MITKPGGLAKSFLLALLLLGNSTFAQQQTVSGKVTSKTDNKPIQGASVQVKGTTTGTQTDAEGLFKINIPSGNAVLVISYIGFDPLETPVQGGQTVGILLLTPNTSSLNEIVVTGYSSQRKKDLTGSVSVVSVEDAKKQPVADINNMLQGQVSGLTVLSSGQPGQAPAVRLRGFNSFGNNTPLYVVDGVPTQNVADLNPNDFASVQVLKDAGASSIYGSRASNGVIVITTRKGSGKVKLSYDGYVGTQVPKGGNVWNILSPQEMANLKWTALKNANQPLSDAQYGSGTTPVLPDYILPAGAKEGDPAVDPSKYNVDPFYNNGSTAGFYQIVKANKAGTDWYHEIFKPKPITQQNIAVSGGGDQGSYLFSLNYFNQQGTLINTYLKRYTVRSNSQYKVSNYIRIGENISYSIIDNPQISALTEGSAIGMALRENPIIPVYDIKGNYAGTAGKDLGNAKNPVAIQQRTANNRGQASRLFGNIFAEVDVLKNLTLRSSFGGENYSGYNRSFSYPEYENSENLTTNSYSEATYSGYNWTWTNTLSYHLTTGNHDLKLVAGTEAFKFSNRNLGGTTLGYFSFDPNYTNLSTGSGTQTNYSNQNGTINSTVPNGAGETLASYFGRLDYVYKDKYLLGATIRRDGSSKFINNRWGTFPAVSAGWRISQEAFLQNARWITDLKIRGSYGTMGNQFNALATNSYTLYGSNKQTTYYDLGGTSNATVNGLSLAQYGNPNGKWESDVNANFGFDATLWRGLLEISADYYRKDIKDLLYNPALPGTAGGATVPYSNVATMKNSGIDLNIGSHFDLHRDWHFDVTGTLTTFKNEITQISVGGAQYFDQESRRFNGSFIIRNAVGHAISEYYGYKVIGFWNSQAEIDAANQEAQKATGDPNAVYQTDAGIGRFRYADTKNQGRITADSKQFLGNPSPKFSYGLNIAVQYKRFDFSAFFYGTQGNKIWNNVKWWTDFYGSFPGGANSKTALYDSWTPTHTNAKAPIQEAGSFFSTQSVPNSYFVENGSYLRAKNMVLGYTFSFAKLKSAGISRLRAYIQAANLFTITKYSGIDPEITGGTTNFGIDEGAYASPRQYLFGLQATF